MLSVLIFWLACAPVHSVSSNQSCQMSMLIAYLVSPQSGTWDKNLCVGNLFERLSEEAERREGMERVRQGRRVPY